MVHELPLTSRGVKDLGPTMVHELPLTSRGVKDLGPAKGPRAPPDLPWGQGSQLTMLHGKLSTNMSKLSTNMSKTRS